MRDVIGKCCRAAVLLAYAGGLALADEAVLAAAAAGIPWEWDASLTVRAPAATATASLASFVSRGPVAEGTGAALAAFDSRVRTTYECDVDGFSTRRLGAALIVR